MFQGGWLVLKHTFLITSLILLGLLVFSTFRDYHPSKRKESWIPVFSVLILLLALLLDGRVADMPQPVSFLTISIVISSVLYYIWLHFQFVRAHENALAAEQRIQIMMTQIQPHPQDTVDMIIYANSQIKREGSPVKNIVIDLSNNGGGNADAAIFVISWFLGEVDIALRDTFSGAESNAIYLADVNLDGQFDDQDNVAEGYRLYCLTTNNSFSCGNLVPAACRSSGRVTLIGQPTGGGSCVVQPCTTAAGTLFHIPGNKQVSIIKNGSFYNTDDGIEPDFRLEKPESFYDRPALVEYLHNLK